VGFICGRGVKIVNTKTGAEKYFWPAVYNDKDKDSVAEKVQKENNPQPVIANHEEEIEEPQETFAILESQQTTTKTSILKNFNCAGTCAIVFNPMKRLMALGEKTIKPKVHVYSYNDAHVFTLKSTIYHTTTMEFTDMSFSRDGEWLALLGSLPDHKLSVWDWQNKKRFVINIFETKPKTLTQTNVALLKQRALFTAIL